MGPVGTLTPVEKLPLATDRNGEYHPSHQRALAEARANTNFLGSKAKNGESGDFALIHVGLGADTHRLVEGRPLILGGVHVPFERGLLGHSDADVVLHAVADALLGAAGLGDIGDHFPDSDLTWKDANSVHLVEAVVAMLGVQGWRTVNCDLVVHAQAPKLGTHKNAVRASVARILGVEESQVNVKAKTGELVGPVGRGEAIGCDAVVLIERAGG